MLLRLCTRRGATSGISSDRDDRADKVLFQGMKLDEYMRYRWALLVDGTSTRALLRAGAPRPLPALHLRDLTLLASDDVARKLLKLGTLGRVEDLPTHGDRALVVGDYYLDERFVGVGRRPRRRPAHRHTAVGHRGRRPKHEHHRHDGRKQVPHTYLRCRVLIHRRHA